MYGTFRAKDLPTSILSLRVLRFFLPTTPLASNLLAVFVLSLSYGSVRVLLYQQPEIEKHNINNTDNNNGSLHSNYEYSSQIHTLLIYIYTYLYDIHRAAVPKRASTRMYTSYHSEYIRSYVLLLPITSTKLLLLQSCTSAVSCCCPVHPIYFEVLTWHQSSTRYTFFW